MYLINNSSKKQNKQKGVVELQQAASDLKAYKDMLMWMIIVYTRDLEENT